MSRNRMRKHASGKRAGRAANTNASMIKSYSSSWKAPKPEFRHSFEDWTLNDFFNCHERNQLRVDPPYQRDYVWDYATGQLLLESFLIRRPVPPVYLRVIDHPLIPGGVYEAVDGKQRILTVVRFLNSEIPFPSGRETTKLFPLLSGKLFKELPPQVQRFIRELKLTVCIIRDLDNVKSAKNIKCISDTFRRIQSGEHLRRTEDVYSMIHSRIRNAAVYYADTSVFDEKKYVSTPGNPNRHHFFKHVSLKDNRKLHVTLMTGLFLTEESGISCSHNHILAYTKRHVSEDGFGDCSYVANYPPVGRCIAILDELDSIFERCKSKTRSGTVTFLSKMPFIQIAYLLHKELRKSNELNDKYCEAFCLFLEELYDLSEGVFPTDPVRLTKEEYERIQSVLNDKRHTTKVEAAHRLNIAREFAEGDFYKRHRMKLKFPDDWSWYKVEEEAKIEAERKKQKRHKKEAKAVA